MGVSGSDTESDVPSRRRRFRVVWNADPHSEAQTALTLLQVLARRVGAVPVGAPVPVAIRHHRWSPFFVPLLWGASGVDANHPVLDMLVSTASVVFSSGVTFQQRKPSSESGGQCCAQS